MAVYLCPKVAVQFVLRAFELMPRRSASFWPTPWRNLNPDIVSALKIQFRVHSRQNVGATFKSGPPEIISDGPRADRTSHHVRPKL